MPATLVCTALHLAICQHRPTAGLIVHLDRGSQYTSHGYRDLLDKHGLVGSMSRKGICWDTQYKISLNVRPNLTRAGIGVIAVMVRFFLNLKMERVWRQDYANQEEAIRDVTDYIVNFYNRSRLHSTLGYLSPNAY